MQRIFVFEKDFTQRFLKLKKELKYLNFWNIDDCDLHKTIEKVNNELKIQRNIQDGNHYIAQFFPFINKNGDLMVLITYSHLSEPQFDKMKDHLQTQFRGVYDNFGNKYLAMIYNETKDAIFNGIDNGIDRFQANQVLKADQVDLSKVRMR